MYESEKSTLLSYSDFAELCNNKAGVRAVAHAIGLNPVSVIIPCHLVVPKESIDKIREIKRRAESTIFKGEDLCLNSILSDTAIDFGEYAQGKELKRVLIMHDLK
jgi:O-6-methylguanine DNA methyltransferase